jgi:hypothetical protein
MIVFIFWHVCYIKIQINVEFCSNQLFFERDMAPLKQFFCKMIGFCSMTSERFTTKVYFCSLNHAIGSNMEIKSIYKMYNKHFYSHDNILVSCIDFIPKK